MTHVGTPDFTIKRNDLLPTLRAVLVDADGTPADLTNADTVRFMMRAVGDSVLKVDSTDVEVIAPPENGVVDYAWQDDDTDTAEMFEAEFEVVFTGTGKKETFPNDDHQFLVRVYRDMGS